MHCDYYDTGRCGSCTWLPTPYDAQLAEKQRHSAGLLAGVGDEPAWLPPRPSAEAGFRSKAKMVVAGTLEEPTLGILDPRGRGVDLRECGLHVPALHDALPALAAFVTRAALPPYDVPSRSGELKHVIVTASPDDELLVRFVLRSTEGVPRIRKHLPWLTAELPGIRVVSANVQPRHAAVLEGEQEIPLLGESLPVRINGFVLHLRPQSFFQTNLDVAAALYSEAAAWVDEIRPRSVWDLYCGVGGFALHLAGTDRQVHGVEVSDQAVEAACTSAAEAGLAGATFEAGDATAWAVGRSEAPDLVVVNPPRRGIGDALCAWLESSGPRHLLYSSCNPVSLADDLAALPSYRRVKARVFDMFPQTAHQEVLVLCSRTDGRPD